VLKKLKDFFIELGHFFSFFIEALREFPANFRHPIEIIKNIWSVGVMSIPIIVATSFCVGLILGMQLGNGMERIIAGTAQYMSGALAVSTVLELGPIFSALILVSRVCSSVTAQIGTMKVTEQIDALRTLSVNPIGYLVTPRIIAGMISLPVLGSMSIIATMFGGWIMLSSVHGVDTTTYLMWSQLFLKVRYVWESITKMTVLGGMLLAVSTYHGFYTSGGAVGVGNSTIKSVVTSSFLVILIDYVMSSIFSYIK
jgi:phospholipid/cholesterol/gamma-HCH transport system permease protein